jgi:hypothetical protein
MIGNKQMMITLLLEFLIPSLILSSLQQHVSVENTPVKVQILVDCMINSTNPACLKTRPTAAECKNDSSRPGCIIAPTAAECRDLTDPACLKTIPTVAECKANPVKQGCKIIPTVAECKADKTRPGCKIIPTVAECENDSTRPGCIITPTLAECEADPSKPGCIITPTAAECKNDTTRAGCTPTTGVDCTVDRTNPKCHLPTSIAVDCTVDRTNPKCPLPTSSTKQQDTVSLVVTIAVLISIGSLLRFLLTRDRD